MEKHVFIKTLLKELRIARFRISDLLGDKEMYTENINIEITAAEKDLELLQDKLDKILKKEG